MTNNPEVVNVLEFELVNVMYPIALQQSILQLNSVCLNSVFLID